MKKVMGWVRYWTIAILLALAWTVSADMLPPPEDGNLHQLYTIVVVQEDGSVQVVSEPASHPATVNLYHMLIGDGNAYMMMKVDTTEIGIVRATTRVPRMLCRKINKAIAVKIIPMRILPNTLDKAPTIQEADSL